MRKKKEKKYIREKADADKQENDALNASKLTTEADTPLRCWLHPPLPLGGRKGR